MQAALCIVLPPVNDEHLDLFYDTMAVVAMCAE
jgi:hypothetical protein